jgi:ribosomal protein S12 methylthiotransferase accessory factor
MPNLFARAASSLLGQRPEESWGPHVRPLLEALDYAGTIDADSGGSGPETRHRAQLLKAASRFLRIFELAAPDAPGLVSFGAEFDPALADALHADSPVIGVSGVGVSLQEAFQGCVGEGIEYLSQLQTEEDVLLKCGSKDPIAGFGPQTQEFLIAYSAYRLHARGEISWYRAKRLNGGDDVVLPADLCLRRPPGQREITPPFPLSTGSAAGTCWDAAVLHGLLELIERDAASLWWRGGNRGRLIPPGDEVQIMAQALLSRLRRNLSTRRTWLLDITTDIAVPCVAAVSCRADGFGVAFGLAARPTLAAAARSAILEMCQIELAYAVVEAKCRERGEAALSERDRVHRRRATLINADRCLLLQPVAKPAERWPIEATDVSDLLQLIAARLRRFGIETFVLNLTRSSFAVPVARVIAPGLQLEPSEIITPRLADMIARTGGSAGYTGGVALI